MVVVMYLLGFIENLGLPKKAVITVLGGAVLIGAVMLYGSYQYSKGVADTKQQQYLAELEEFKKQTIELDKASKQLLHITQQLSNQSREWKNSYEEVTKKEPLPADCVISSSRLHNINAAIEQAASARKSIVTMPADRKIK